MDFLKYLDVLIGLAVIMLLGGTVVMAITQFYLNTSYVRSRCLRDGMAELIRMLSPERLGADATYISERVLRYPVAGRPNTAFGNVSGAVRNWWRKKVRGKTALPCVNPAEVIEREEFCLMLLEWAAGEGPLADQDHSMSLTADAAANERVRAVREKVTATVKQGGFADPAAVLQLVRARAMEHERAAPGKRAFEWRSAALLDVAAADLTGKVYSWYDNTMRRVADNFALHAKVAGSVVALGIAIGLQIDTIDLLRKLSQDKAYREALVARSEAAMRTYEELSKVPPAPGNTQTKNEAKDRVDATLNELKAAQLGVGQKAPEVEWRAVSWVPGGSLPWLKLSASWPGVLISWILLSLGAPFWYDLLKRLLGLRSILAQKEEQDRKARADQQGDEAVLGGAGPAPVAAVQTLSTEPGLVEIVAAANVRSGRPSVQSPVVRMLEPDTLLTVKGAVKGDSAVTAAGVSIDKWFVTPDDEYVWAGVTDQP